MREEYKQFERDISTLKKSFEGALARGDNSLFDNEPELIEPMERVAAFDFSPNEIEESVDFTWHVRTIDLQVAIYEWFEVVDAMPEQLEKFKADYHVGTMRGISLDEKYQMLESCNEIVKDDFGKYQYTIYRDRDLFRRLLSIARVIASSSNSPARDAPK